MNYISIGQLKMILEGGVDYIELIFVISGLIAIAAFTLYMSKKGFVLLGHSEKMYSLSGGATFKVCRKQLVCAHSIIWLITIWFIGTILLFELPKAQFSDVLSEWGAFFVFVLFFFSL